jgi:hypothetical protein
MTLLGASARDGASTFQTIGTHMVRNVWNV